MVGLLYVYPQPLELKKLVEFVLLYKPCLRPEYVRNAVYKLKKRGFLKRVERAKYTLTKSGLKKLKYLWFKDVIKFKHPVFDVVKIRIGVGEDKEGRKVFVEL